MDDGAERVLLPVSRGIPLRGREGGPAAKYPSRGEAGHPAVHLAPVSDLRVEEIDTAGGLEALKPLWDGLLAVCPHRTPFLTHEWTTNWWKHFGKGKGLSVLVVHEDGRPVLIAPLMKYAGRVHGGLPIPALIIESIANYHSNRADFIFEHG